MLNWLAQIGALIIFNLRTLPRRRGSALAAIVGIAGVVAVLVGVLSIGRGFHRVMISGGSPENAIVVRAGSDSEMVSILLREDVRIISSAPGVARQGEEALASPELFVVIALPKKTTGTDANVPMRGVDPVAFKVRDKIGVTRGRRFEPGRNEVIVGRGAAAEFTGLDVGQELKIGPSRWRVVGEFEADGGLTESEILTDAAVLSSAYRRGASYQSVLVKLASPGSFQQFKDALTSDPRLNVKVVREAEYYAEQSRVMHQIINGLGTLVAVLMAVGAVFGALNTMYTAVAARAREIATLKALGFRSSPVIVSVIVESLLLAIVGGAVGAVLAYLAFDGYRTATMNWQSFSQVAFAFEVDLPLLVRGIVYALAIGLIGGLFPAIRAARQPIALALRAA